LRRCGNQYEDKKELSTMSIEISLVGKTAAITGGGRGLGKEIAMTLAKAGAKVWIGNRTEEQSVKTVNEMK
jgi:NAD(P)-dependent dehydrogenase (short-subunit alcohol dehydrogenase family)